MVQVKGIPRLETQRLRMERVGRVKYSILCPCLMESPKEASRAIPTSFSWGRGSKKDREEPGIFRLLFAYNKPRFWRCQEGFGIGDRAVQKCTPLGGWGDTVIQFR